LTHYPYFPFYPQDFLADPVVVCMTLEEQGAYWRLCCHAWKPPSWDGGKATVGSLHNDPTLLAALSGAGPRWEDLAPAVLRAFHLSPDGKFLVQRRLTEEWEKLQGRVEQARNAASASWKSPKRGRREKQPVDDAPAMPEHELSNADAMRPQSDRKATAQDQQCGRNAIQKQIQSNDPTDRCANAGSHGGDQSPLKLEAQDVPPTPRKQHRAEFSYIAPALDVLSQHCPERFVKVEQVHGKVLGILCAHFTRHDDLTQWAVLGDFLAAGGEERKGVLSPSKLSYFFEDLLALALDWNRKGRPNPEGRRPPNGRPPQTQVIRDTTGLSPLGEGELED
jgi:uncharacterized protein YdaU (DUF1376 family)